MRTLLSSNVIWTWLVCFRRPGPCWNNLPPSCTHALLWLGMLPICKFCVGCNASYWTVDVTTLEFRDFLKIGSLFACTNHCVATIDIWCALLAVVPHGLFSKLLLSVLSRGCCETLFSIVFFLCVCDKCRRFDGKRASPTCVPKCCPLPDELFFFHLSQSVASANSKIITYSSVHSLRCVSLWRKCFVFGSPIEGARPNCDALTVCAWRL